MNLHSGIVRILTSNCEEVVGTGFLASESIVVTCAHVVEAAWINHGEPVNIQFYDAENAEDNIIQVQVDLECWSEKNDRDIAILRLDRPLPPGASPLLLGTSPLLPGHQFISFGFPRVGKYEALPVQGDILGRIHSEKGWEVLALDCANVTQGMSGSPVVDNTTGLVVGMIDHFPSWTSKERGQKRQVAGDKFGRLEGINFATTSETIRSICKNDLEISDRCPYLGLAPFSENDAEFFFGRDTIISTVLDRLRNGERFLAIVGPSGSGKSSLIQAGVFPSLREGKISGSRNWHLIRFRPGADPYKSLTQEGLGDLGQETLSETVQNLFANNPDTKHLVIYGDQFEETFALCPEPKRTQFLEEFLDLLNQSQSITLIISLQAGYYYGEALSHPVLGSLIDQGQLTVRPISNADEMQETIVKPASLVGLQFESGLASVIVKESLQVDHPLPLVQETLLQLWEEAKSSESFPLIKHQSYEEIVGGVSGAIRIRATKTFNNLSESDQVTAQQIFTRLVHYDNGQETSVLQRQLLPDLVTQSQTLEDIQRVIKILADARLLVIGWDASVKTQTVEIIHNVLIQEWDKLRRWIEEKKEFYLWRQRLDERLNEWLDKNRDQSMLLRGSVLAEATRWSNLHPDELNSNELEFINTSIHLKDKEEQRQKIVLGIAIVTAILMGVLAWFGFDRAGLANENALALATEVAVRARTEATALSAQSEAESNMINLSTQVAERIAAEEEAYNSQLEAEEQINARETQEAIAIEENLNRQQQERIVKSIALAQQSEIALENGYKDRAVLLALYAIEKFAYTPEAEYALGQAVWNYRRQIITKVDWEINDISLSPNKELLAIAGDELTVWLWSFGTEEELIPLAPPGIQISFIEWSPDGTKIAGTGRGSGTIFLWDAKTGEIIGEMTGEQKWVDHLAWASDSRRLGVTTLLPPEGNNGLIDIGDEAIRIWDTAMQTPIMTSTKDQDGGIGSPSDLIWIPDSDTLISTSFDHTIRSWDAITGEAVNSILVVGSPLGISYLPDIEKLLITFNDNSVHFFDAKTLAHERLFSIGVGSTAWSNIRGLAVSDGHTLSLMSDLNGSKSETLFNHPDTIWPIEWSKNGDYLASASREGTIVITLMRPHLERHYYSHGSLNYPVRMVVEDVAWSPDGNKIISADGVDAIIMDVPSSNDIPLNKVEGFPSPFLSYAHVVEWSPSGNRIAIGTNDLHVWSADSQEEIFLLEKDNTTIESLAWSPDDDHIAIIWDDGSFQIINMSNSDWNYSLNFPNNQSFTDVIWSPNGKQIALTGSDGTVYIWNFILNKEDFILDGHFGLVSDVIWSPDGKKIATGGVDGTVKLWDANSGATLAIFSNHEGPITSVDWSPNGERIVSASEDYTSRVWDVESTSELFVYEDYLPINDAQWAPNGSFIAFAYSSGGTEILQAWETTDELIAYARECCVMRDLTQDEKIHFGLVDR